MENIKQLYSYRDKVIEAGEVYHVTQRAPGKEMLFIEDSDYLNMLALLKKWAKEFDVDIFAFCLMPNHYHLLLRINKPNLPQAMHQLNTTYGKRFNVKYYRKGHVFCGVYRASMCMDDTHLIASSIYIHLNPQKAGIVKDVLTYRWSSVNIYINPDIKSFVNGTFILKIINEEVKAAADTYRKMLADCFNAEYNNIIENPKAVIDFTKAIFKKLLRHLRGRSIKKDFMLAEKNMDVLIKRIRNKKRRRKPEDKQAIRYIIAQLKSRGYNLTEMSKILNISRSALHRLIIGANLTNDVERQV